MTDGFFASGKKELPNALEKENILSNPRSNSRATSFVYKPQELGEVGRVFSPFATVLSC
jgi:hypothetical protein